MRYLVPHIKGRTQTKGVREESVEIFEPKRKEGSGGWRKVHKDDFHVSVTVHHIYK